MEWAESNRVALNSQGKYLLVSGKVLIGGRWGGAQGQVNDLVKYPFVAYLAVCLCKPNGKKQHEAPGNLCG